MESSLTVQLREYKELLNRTLEELESYNKRATKACSARIRKLTNQIGKDGKMLRAELLAADKAQ